ncbi:MAG: NrfD/PsrC family molybdoenzyme membrane anchor subunit [Gemmatimonadota bacterium]|nr:NrfD/PsrC family molybdoenzyme membrane anchor subunit [Gemmatimonadota bacterium]
MTPRDDRASEERLDALREEAARTGTVQADGGRIAGGPIPPAAGGTGGADAGMPGYYGRPVVKPPVWTWEVPLYFFVGGLSGMAAVLAAAAWLTGAGEPIVRPALWLAFAGAALAPVLLILDLGRPERFLNMLRVFKWRSPMSVGAWALAAWGAHSTAALAFYEWIVRAEPAGTAGMVADVLFVGAMAGGAVYGAMIAVYTGVLIGATAIPAWHLHHESLPVHFGIAGLGSAAAALELLGVRVGALDALGFGAAAVETAFGLWIEIHRHGAADRSLRSGASGWMLRCAGVLAGPVALGLRFADLVPWAAAAFLAGALLSRYGWLEAGRASGRDPEAVFAAQRER